MVALLTEIADPQMNERSTYFWKSLSSKPSTLMNEPSRFMPPSMPIFDGVAERYLVTICGSALFACSTLPLCVLAIVISTNYRN